MCKTEEQAWQAYQLSRDTLKSLNLDIHPIDAPGSKSRIGNFSKEGLLFLGIRFEGQDIFPASKVVKRFESKIEEILKSTSGDSLFKTLQRLTNLINGWGKCYRSMKVLGVYLKLDEFIKVSVSAYLGNVGVQLVGKDKRKHMKLLGIPSLSAMVEHRKKPVPVAKGDNQNEIATTTPDPLVG